MHQVVKVAKAIHTNILPKDSGVGMFPYAWLIYLLMFIIPIFFGVRPVWHYIATVISVFVFLVLYFRGFWVSGKTILWYITGILLIGLVSVFYNTASSVFFVYAAAFAVNLRHPRAAMIVVFAIAIFAGLFSLAFKLPPFFYLPATVITLLVGFLNIYEGELKKKNRLLKMSQDELRLAAAATERERIARDLHDLIGHTFSVITMKSQLASKLIDRDLALAKIELQDLEQISRKALSEVREAVTGYNRRNMASEISKAKIVTQSADIELCCSTDAFPSSEEVNAVFAFMIREAITNIIKHADADKCWLKYTHKNGKYTLAINDNGAFSNHDDLTKKINLIREGNGLNGMRERIESIGGQLTIKQDNGFTLLAEAPADEQTN